MTTMDGDELQRLWSLIEDLTHQLQANRQLCESLQAQADQLKGQALHSGTGYALRRFNTDISKEKFESELEQLNAYLVKENQSLAHESKQQALLLREYENTLETVMAKFRTFSHSTQQHMLQLTAHYENLLANTTQAAAETTLAAETTFSGTLEHLGGLVRKALRTMDGEASTSDSEGSDDEETDVFQQGQAVRSLPVSRTKSAKQRQHEGRNNGWSADPRWYGSGGYTGKDLDPQIQRSERALDMLTEEERLRFENESLKELLGLKERSDALATGAPGADASAPTDAAATTTTVANHLTPVKSAQYATTLSPKPQASPTSPTASRNPLAVDQATIEAEGSGQPPMKALEISETLRPGDRSPSQSPTKRKDQILEEAILEEEGEGPASGSSAIAETASGQGVGSGEREGEGLQPNLVAEAAPSALVGTGIDHVEGDGHTSVTSVSGVSGNGTDAVDGEAAVSAEMAEPYSIEAPEAEPTGVAEAAFVPAQEARGEEPASTFVNPDQGDTAVGNSLMLDPVAKEKEASSAPVESVATEQALSGSKAGSNPSGEAGAAIDPEDAGVKQSTELRSADGDSSAAETPLVETAEPDLDEEAVRG